jgi:hypothetical protein
MLLGEGRALALSRDGKQALLATLGSPARLELVSTGSGAPRALDLGGRQAWSARFLPDGSAVLVLGSKAGEVTSLLELQLSDGSSRLVTRGLFGGIDLSPDGRTVVSLDEKRHPVLVDVASGLQTPLSGLSNGVLCFAPDGRHLLVQSPAGEILVYDPATGGTSRTPVQVPPDLARYDLSSLVVSRDGRTLFFGFQRTVSSQLLVLSGVDGT